MSNPKIVLSHTSHPGNIGATARAMLNMGLSELVLVNPKQFPHPEAIARASHADSILDNAVVTDSVEQAISDCHWTFGTSARERHLQLKILTPRQAAEFIAKLPGEQKAAILFGEERTGLTNGQLQLCDYHIVIPTISSYSSLNLAQAVQIIAYELYLSLGDEANSSFADASELPTRDDMELFYVHLQQVLDHTGFLHSGRSQKILGRLRRLFDRAKPDVRELNILRGILKSVKPYDD